jgi:hypothetical protein
MSGTACLQGTKGFLFLGMFFAVLAIKSGIPAEVSEGLCYLSRVCMMVLAAKNEG